MAPGASHSAQAGPAGVRWRLPQRGPVSPQSYISEPKTGWLGEGDPLCGQARGQD
jgi:hypothetical protein